MQMKIIDNTGPPDDTLTVRGHSRKADHHWSSNTAYLRSSASLLAVTVLFFCVCVDQARAASEPAMSKIDTATTQVSDNGLYKVSFESVEGRIVINTIHEWLLTVVSADGMPVDGLTITIDGGMPMHDHGLPTAPRVTESLGEGQYRVEGFKFQMPGHWTTTFNMTDNDSNSDSVTF
ncbi:FixH family protein, partial [Granulosicoccus sp.]|nr:FixH family protein [Granulosicoccus sp.]